MVSHPSLVSTLSLLYLGIVATGFAWLIRFRILSVNGLVFQTQVAYLIPIFGVIFWLFFNGRSYYLEDFNIIRYNSSWNLYCKKKIKD